MRVRFIVGFIAALSVTAAIGVVGIAVTFPTSSHVLDAKQLIMMPWLRPAHLGDGGPATELLLCYPMDLAMNAAGDLLISDRGRDRRGRVIWRIDAEGLAHIVAGTGRRGRATAGSAGRLSFDRPESLAIADDGSLFVSDAFNHSIYRIDVDGTVRRVAGTGSPGYSGDGGAASQAMLFRPAEIGLDSSGSLFIADVRNHRVRKVDNSGQITTVAGTGERGFSPDGTPADEARLDTPWGLTLDRQDRLIIADSANQRVRLVDSEGRFVTLAGSGRRGFDGDGGLATEGSFNFPEALFLDAAGRLFIGDEHNHAVRVVDTDGVVSTVIGTGVPGRATIGAYAENSPVNDPESVLVTPAGDLIVSDGNNGRVLRISSEGIVHSLAGRGEVEPCAAPW